MNPRALVFDLDGTLIDNMGLHTEAFQEFNRRHGLAPYDKEARARFDGRRNAEIMPALFGRELSPGELARYADEKESLYRELSRGRLTPLRGLSRLLDAAEARGLGVVVATSAPRENVAHSLGEIGLASRLARVVRSDEVQRGKPHPDVFLAAARLAGVPPEECLAFEDAPLGVKAARAAGMPCVAVSTGFDADGFAAHDAGPDHVVKDFEEYLAGPGAWLLG